ncbi:N-acetylglucosamine-6-phosphate deacetylase [Jonesia quinghaiensis]|uniref:N-acetylglucosamine-6-phosphate deacetylase n=1 Tax=Jonesia quinghaiensis TaxID=262806 RepID=UPI000416C69C|nr:N-acetylglucosamine-6-phosphate deacetylase [Jonesia quinghaiensis]
MTSRVLTADRVFTGTAIFTPGWVVTDGQSIVEVGRGTTPPRFAHLPTTNYPNATLTPGFVDIHCHGGGGATFGIPTKTDAGAGSDSGATTNHNNTADAHAAGVHTAARTVLTTHRKHGTTTMIASLVTDSIDNLTHAVAALGPLVDTGELAGIHLEGPWLSPAHKGAHTPHLLRDPHLDDITRVLDAHPGAVRMVTIAPELPGGLEAVTALTERCVIAALGHSDASFDDARNAVDAGVTNVTHLFNAMNPIHHRTPGPIIELLADERVAVELICDGVHVHPAVLAHAAATAGRWRTIFVTDAMAATDMHDGQWDLGGLSVDVTDGVARLSDSGAIAGSTLTMDAAVRFAVTVAGIDLLDALTAATSAPALLIGRSDVGYLRAGARADIVVLDDGLHVREVLTPAAHG